MKNQRLIYLILIAGLILRILFLLKGANIYYGNDYKYVNNDSGSFSDSFLNLINEGHYTFNPTQPDASYYRLPGYPFFWGLHFLIFGKWVYIAVAFTQLLLDTLAIWLVFKIISKIGSLAMAFTGAIIYAFNPFIIIWTTITGSELLGTFLCILYLFYFTWYSTSKYFPLLAGLICVYMFFTREYLGIFLPISIICIFRMNHLASLKIKIKKALYFSLVFLSVYSIWPIRNYLHSGQMVLLHGKSTGYTLLGDDFMSFRSWMYSWNEGIEPYFEKIIKTNETVTFPDDIYCSENDKEKIAGLISQCRNCGSSFYAWRHVDFKGADCNDEITSGFNSLRENYIKCKPANYYFFVPLKNLKKAIFKNNLQEINKKPGIVQMVQTALFSYRTFLVLTGFIGLIVYRKINLVWMISIFSLFMYLFIGFYIRQVEMRYLLQADTLLIIPLAMLIGGIIERRLSS